MTPLIEPERIKLTVCLGANWGDRATAVADALDWLKENLEDFEESDIYETPAFGHDGAPYMNAVCRGCIPSGRLAVFEAACKGYESAHGRDAEARRLKRVPIDIDIVMAGNKILRPIDYRCAFFRQGLLRLEGEECDLGIGGKQA